ncbi:hypothetical protein JSY36_11320 [Bacillus sp. H-16]|uniref:hypothetical protein n=1 Tax=Alteribacter salitolerans TaxID=2912333 RepID=UPI001965C6E7|nr:hypothetical protein [Alteribacter salitolerans]MBM7096334.1 hypothetical protein [Alteribacter salitolerans]
MNKTKGTIFYSAVALFSLLFIAVAVWINQSYFAGVVNQPIIITMGLCILGLSGFELYKKTFEQRHAVSTAVLCATSIVFLVVIFPGNSYTASEEQLVERLSEEHGEEARPLEVFTSSFTGNERPSVFVTRYYVHSVEAGGEELFYFVNPASGEAIELETADEGPNGE